VTVKESDGSEQSFVVPFASLAILQREGQVDYALAAVKRARGAPAEKNTTSCNLTLPGGIEQRHAV
jgi:outer membrane usher protein